MKTCILSLVCGFALACAAPSVAWADEIVIDFQHLEHEDGLLADHGQIVTEDGFRLLALSGIARDLRTYGTLHARYTGSTALTSTGEVAMIDLRAEDGRPFDLVSIDVGSERWGELLPAYPVDFQGLRGDGSLVYYRQFINGSPRMTTWAFGPAWADLVAVRFRALPFGGQFDNIVVHAAAIDPEAMLEDVLADVLVLDLEAGIEESLTSKLESAAASLAKGGKNSTRTAGNKLRALLNAVRAQSGKAIDPDDAGDLIAAVEAILDRIAEA